MFSDGTLKDTEANLNGFREHTCEHKFELAEGVSFQQQVKINTKVEKPEERFGIHQNHIDKFIQSLLHWEIDGRRFRTKYQIEMSSGAPQAENFLWTILGNKVSSYNYNRSLIMLIGNQRSGASVSSCKTDSIALE